MEKVLIFLKDVLDMRIKMLEDMLNPAIGYYYLHVNGSIRYMSFATAEADGGKEFLDKNKNIVHYWFVEDANQFKEMVIKAKMLNEHIHGR
jgi:hypothetical protein